MLKAASGGAIVNLSSAAGRLGYAFRTTYASARWGVIGLTQSLAKELGPSNIRDRAAHLGVPYDAMERQYLDRISLRRMIDPEDVAATVVFLASPAGRNQSGQSHGVAGNVETR